MVLAAPGPLLTPTPSSSPPKTPFRSYSAQIRNDAQISANGAQDVNSCLHVLCWSRGDGSGAAAVGGKDDGKEEDFRLEKGDGGMDGKRGHGAQ